MVDKNEPKEKISDDNKEKSNDYLEDLLQNTSEPLILQNTPFKADELIEE